MRTNSPLARRVLHRGDQIGVRFITDVHPGKVLEATRSQAVIKLLKRKNGQPDERSFDGEFLIRFDSGAWRVAGLPVDNTVVYNGFNLCTV